MASSWSIAEVFQWAQSIIDEKSALILQESGVDGEVLLSMQEADMKELGLTFGARRKLSLRLKALRQESTQQADVHDEMKQARSQLSAPMQDSTSLGSDGKLADSEALLLGMGFEKDKVNAALVSAGGDSQLAVAILVSCPDPQQSATRDIARAPSRVDRSVSLRSAYSSSPSHVPVKLETPVAAWELVSKAPDPQQSAAETVTARAPSFMNQSVSSRSASSSSSSSVPMKLEAPLGPEHQRAESASVSSNSQLSLTREASSRLEALHDEAWQTPLAKRPRLTPAPLKLRRMPEMSEEDLQSVLFTRRVSVDCSFAIKALKTYMAPRKEKLAGRRGKVEVKKTQPEWMGVLLGSADSEELEATLGLPSTSFFSSVDITAPSLSEWTLLQIPSSSDEDNGEESVCDFKSAMEAAASISAVALTKQVSMGTQLMHQEVLKSGRAWLDPNAPYMNASPNEFRWTSKPRWACRHPKCQAMSHGGWFYNHSDAASSGGPPKDHANLFKHPADFVYFAWDKSTKVPMSVTYKQAGSNWRQGRSVVEVELSFKAALPTLLKLSDFAAYWPADRQRAHWRVFSRPITEAPEVEPVMLGRYAIEAKRAKASPMALGAEDTSVGKVKPLIIPSSSNTPPAEQPPFQVPLKSEQLRALAWMLKREEVGAGGTYLSTHIVERRFAGSDLCLQLRVEREYNSSRGGILAHQMGFGKTAIIIALILQSKISRARGPLTAGTLIVTPGSSALHNQWQMELKKFLGDDHAGLIVMSICTMDDFRATSKENLQRADVVVVNGDFFLAAEYRNIFDKSFGVKASDTGYEAVRYAKMRANASAGPVNCFLEQFDWDRVVFDEFHKMVNESKTGLQAWRAFHELHSASRWGLTGTPDVTTALSVSEMAAMLHVFVPPDSRLEAQRFIDVWVRADGWDSDEIKLESHMIEVTPSAAERTLYQATKRMLEAQGTSGEASAQTQLLQLCSHFSPEELANVGSCDAAVKRAWLEQKKAVEEQRSVVQMRSEARDAYSGIDASHARRLRDGLAAAEARLQHIESAYTYFTNTLAFLERVKKGEERALECPICLGDFEKADELSVTKCGHVFCSGCLDETLSITSKVAPDGSAKAACPACRFMLCPVKDKDELSGLCFEADAPSMPGPSVSRYGTKVSHIIEQLRGIHSSGERVLIFVQWRLLLAKIASALEEANIPALYLKGGVAEQQRTISTFAMSEQFRTLLLAMEDDDSGLNLTCANHAFFVHPMDVRNRQVALACERQALGRVRRRGQNKVVHLYRFITKGTVEEILAKQFHCDMIAPP